tara:strand:- start:1070 stop:1264 length:195 start_codon:yes stop_codon:yes gene_type:complete
MKMGVVKMWNSTKGWGFIESIDGEDYFLNITKVRSGQKINQGVRVKFDVEEGHRGPSATNVTLY